MATREFESKYVFDLAETALKGLQSRINYEWAEDCKKQYKYNEEAKMTWWSRFSARFWGVKFDEEINTFEEYVEARKDWLFSEYSTTYTLWMYHTERWDKTLRLINRIKNLAAANVHGSAMTKLDGSEFNTLAAYESWAEDDEV